MVYRIQILAAVIILGGCATTQPGGGSSSSSSSSSGSSGGAPKAGSGMQFNGFYGRTFGAEPESVNKKIDDLNTGATKQTPDIKSAVLLGAEFLNRLGARTLLGVRYTVQKADSGQGTEGGSVNQVMIGIQDISGVAKYGFKLFGLDFNAGAAAGVSVVNDLTINDAGTKTRYSSPGGLILRGFTGVRLDWKYFGLWGEAGYQRVSDKAYKSDQGGKPTSTAGDVTLDLSGPYALGGLGLQF